jgi:CcmD family protein
MMDASARNFTYLAYGLAAAWVILVIYLLTLIRREKSLRAQIDNLRRMLEDKERN